MGYKKTFWGGEVGQEVIVPALEQPASPHFVLLGLKFYKSHAVSVLVKQGIFDMSFFVISF